MARCNHFDRTRRAVISRLDIKQEERPVPLSIFMRDLLPKQAGSYTRAAYPAWAIPPVVTTSGKQDFLHFKI